MNKTYYAFVDELEKKGVSRDYIQGWMGGYLGNPAREEQRVTDAYCAGYADGKGRCTEHAGQYPAAGSSA